jgi:hypothetical protein
MSFDDNDPLVIIAGVIADARAKLGTVVRLPPLSVLPGYPGTIDTRVGRDLMAIFDGWDRAVAAIDAAHAPLQDNWLRLELTQQARINRGQAIINSVATAVSTELGKASATAKSLVAWLTQETLPPRPEPVDATQEAALTNLRGDLRLVLDHVHADGVEDAMLDELRQRVAADDALGVWFLAGDSGWPALYLRARGVDDPTLYDLQVADALSASSGASEPDNGEKARQILAGLKGPKGLVGALVAMGNLAAWKFEGLGTFAPGATTETDFTIELPA